jgi:dephospho-CoA kinase
MPHKPIIGVIGSIGAGKSVVAGELARLGGELIVADALGHDGLRQPSIKAQIRGRFGDGVFKPDGDIDRRRLASIVFNDDAERRALEAIQFPYIGARVREKIAQATNNPAVQFVVLDAAVLLEAGWRKDCDRILLVDAPRELRLERLKSRGWSAEELDRRERSQLPLEEKRKAADAVLVNDGTVAEAAKKVRAVLQSWNALPQKSPL